MNDDGTRPAGEVGPDVGMGKVDPEMARVFQEEALRVVKAGEDQGVHLRVIGALAFWHHCPEFGYIQEKLNRVYTDIDFAGYGKQDQAIRKLFVSIGYDEDIEINAFHAEGGRLIFNNPTNHIHVDVFMDKLDFCHPIPWKGRLEVDNPTIPLAELLLEKMQIVKINEKDIIDTIMLLLEHEICARRRGPHQLAARRQAVRRRMGAVAYHHHEPREGARLPAAPRPGGRPQADRGDARREAHERDGRLPQGHPVEAARQGGRQGQVVQRDRLMDGRAIERRAARRAPRTTD